MAAQFTTSRRVEFSDTDMAGIAHFTMFYRFMEQAEHDYFRSLDLPIMKDLPDGSVMGFPRVSAKCKFEAPAKYGDEFEIRLNVARKGVKSLTFQIEFWNGDVRVARGELKSCCCVVKPDQPLQSIEIPEDYSSKIVEVRESRSSQEG
jgi:acyl-CoA thioester hydrolase